MPRGTGEFPSLGEASNQPRMTTWYGIRSRPFDQTKRCKTLHDQKRTRPSTMDQCSVAERVDAHSPSTSRQMTNNTALCSKYRLYPISLSTTDTGHSRTP